MSKMNESILSEQILEDMKENRIDHMKYLDDMEVLDSDVDKQVVEAMNAYDYNQYTAADVRRAIYKENRTPEDFAALCPRRTSAAGRDGPDGPERNKKTFWKLYYDVYSFVHCQLL